MSDIVEEFSYDNALSEAATEDLEDIVLKARAEGAVQERERLGIVLQVATGGAAALDRAAEREACARLVEGIGASTTDDIGAAYVASAIRARGEAPLDAFNTALVANPKFQALKAAAHAPKCSHDWKLHYGDDETCVLCGVRKHDSSRYAPKCATCGGTGLRGFGAPGVGPCPDCAPKPDARSPVPGGVLDAEWCPTCRAPMLQRDSTGAVVDGPCRCETFEECPDCGWRPGDELFATRARELALKALRGIRGTWTGTAYAQWSAEMHAVDAVIAALEGK